MTSETIAPGRPRSRKRARGQEKEEEEQHHQARSPTPSAPDDEGDDAVDIERTMREIVGSRAYPATACPSEVPRRLVAERRRRRGGGGGDGGDGDEDWRSMMAPTRLVAIRLARAGQLQITQRGQVVADLDAPLRGPIRLRPMPPPPSPS
jgi:hypothetical protein